MFNTNNKKNTADKLKLYAQVISVFTLGASTLIVLGWLFDLNTLIKLNSEPHLATMKLNTAICFMTLSAVTWSQLRWANFNVKTNRGIYLLLAISLLLSTLTLGEYVFNIDIGLDNVLESKLAGSGAGASEFPGRMSQVTAINMVIFSLALWLVVLNSNRYILIAQLLALIGVWISLTAFSGYFFEVSQLYSLPGYSSISFETSLLFVLLGVSILSIHANKGLMAVVTSELYGGVVARKILPFLILLPYFVGWSRMQLHELGWLSLHISPALLATTYIMIFIVVAWLSARTLNNIDNLRQQHEAQLEKATKVAVSEKNFSDMMIESLPGILYFYNEQKKFLRWNKNFELASGYTGDEIANMHPLDFFLEEEKSQVEDRIKEVFTRGVSSVDARFLAKNGETTPYFFTGRRVVFDEMDCLVGVGIDIAKRKLAEEQLRIAAIAFEAQEGIAVSDAEKVILRVNQSFTKITGYEAAEAIGQKASILKSGYHNEAFYDEMWDAIKTEHHWQGEIINRRKNGEIFPVWLTITAVTNDKGAIINYVSTFSDLTQFKEHEAKIHSLAFYDSLTGLPNRRLLYEHLKQTIAYKSYGALLFIDLDNFKLLNDTKGHNVGDLLLIEVAKRIKVCLRESDFVARLGGDEFVVLLDDLGTDLKQATQTSDEIGETILKAINKPYLLKRYKYYCSASIGISQYGKEEISVDELLKQSDAAMYQAKYAGRNRLRFYDPEVQIKLELKSAIENDLHRALTEDQFKLYYQKQVYHNKATLAAEVLIRWQHPQRGLILPYEFISAAEATGLILPIGQWVLDMACAQLKEWEKDVNTRLLKIAINVSVLQFRQPNFVKLVKQTIKKYQVDSDKIDLELTESIVLDNVDETLTKMKALKKIGLRFSLDDFGTGYSSLSYLTRLPFDQIKIDQSFIRNIGTPQSDVIVQTIIGMAKNLGMEVVAEGVETELQRRFLEKEGCSVMQGYLFGRPVPIETFEKMLKT